MFTQEQAAIVKGLLLRGDKQHDIAAFFGENSARVGEVASGEKHADVDPAPGRQLPSPGMLGHGYAAFIAYHALEVADASIRLARERILAMHPHVKGPGH